MNTEINLDSRYFDKKDISLVFVSFYKSLCKSDNNSTKEQLDDFLSRVEQPTLTEDQRDIFGRPIQDREILEAIALMCSGKSPGRRFSS